MRLSVKRSLRAGFGSSPDELRALLRPLMEPRRQQRQEWHRGVYTARTMRIAVETSAFDPVIEERKASHGT